MSTLYVATDRNYMSPGCDGHGSIAEAVKCLQSAGDYLYAVENGSPRALTPMEEQEVSNVSNNRVSCIP